MSRLRKEAGDPGEGGFEEALGEDAIATTERYLHADVGRLAGVLVRARVLEGGGKRQKSAGLVRPALQMILGELQELARPGEYPKA